MLFKTFKFHVKLQQLITTRDCTLSTNVTAKYPSEEFDLEGEFISYTRFKESHKSLKHFEVAEIQSQFKSFLSKISIMDLRSCLEAKAGLKQLT